MGRKKVERRGPALSRLRIGQKVWIKLGSFWQKLPIVQLYDPDYYSTYRPVMVKISKDQVRGVPLSNIYLKTPKPEEIKWQSNVRCNIDTRKINCIIEHLRKGRTIMYIGKSCSVKNKITDYETDIGVYIKWIKDAESGRFLLTPVKDYYGIKVDEFKRRLMSAKDSGKWFIVYREI